MTEAPPAVAWSDPAPDRPIPLLAALREDMLAHISVEHRGGGLARRVLRAFEVTILSAGFRVTLIYRISHALRGRFGPPGRLAAAVLFWWMRHFYACAIASTARLHGGLILPHPQGIVVGAGAVVGPRAWILQNVTLGGAPGKTGLPWVGADARIFAGAVLAGPVVVGDNVVIGANAVVSRDIPPRSLVRVATVEVLPLADHMIVVHPEDQTSS